MSSLVQEAIVHLNAGRWTEAERKAHQALSLNPRDTAALNVLGCVALKCARAGEAIGLFEQSRELRPRRFHYSVSSGRGAAADAITIGGAATLQESDQAQS